MSTAVNMTHEELLAEVIRLRAKDAPKPLRFDVGQKGGLSVYNLQRFPVTLYREQWERVLEAADQIRAFIAKNDARLVRKGE